MAGRRLTEVCAIAASGARAVEPFEVGGLSLLAVPQLAYDIPGQPASMNGGDADTDLLVLRRTVGGYQPFQRLPVPGGEDAEFFRIGDRAFLAAASVRTGTGPYDYATASPLFEWNGGQFAPFQVIPSKWAYNWHAFTIDGGHYLAHADHVEPSLLYRWTGTGFAAHQQLASRHCRAFASFRADGDHYLLVGCLQSPSRLLRWDDGKFVEHQSLDGLGAREFAVIEMPGALYVVRANFILGTPADPKPELNSTLYQWRGGRLRVAEEFPTTGAADVAVHHDADGPLVFVANALSPEIRFAALSTVYRFR